jgi:hypothetical protein
MRDAIKVIFSPEVQPRLQDEDIEFEMLDIFYKLMKKEFGFQDYVFDWKETDELINVAEKLYGKGYVSYSIDYSNGDGLYNIVFIKGEKNLDFLTFINAIGVGVTEFDAGEIEDL